MPEVLKRVEAVRQFRLASKSAPTQKIAATPTRFHTECIPESAYIALPQVSSERRAIIPMAFLDNKILCGDKLRIIEHATPYHFGVLSSAMHMAWTRSVCGRLESRYQYSALIVYNNFPWPGNVTDKQRQSIEEAAQAILDARTKHPGSSLADLYDPLSMPPELVKAHHKLDAAVDETYSKKKFSGDSDRVAFLFELYQQLASPLEAKKPKRRKLPLSEGEE